MYQNDNKLCVLRFFLEFAKSYVSLRKAHVATLGGEGVEAELWRKHGIPPAHGWLVERSQDLSRKIIAELKYHYEPSLFGFPRGFSGAMGRKATIDAFHLDLKGTLESSLPAFTPVLPLIIHGKGRCLAITMADMRANRSLQNEEGMLSAVRQAVGNEFAKSILAELTLQQRELFARAGYATSNPHKGALKELGVFSTLLHLFGAQGERLPVLDRIERYVYNSGSSQAFRMRTYFFHFGSLRRSYAKDLPSLAEVMAPRWLGSPIQFIELGVIKHRLMPKPQIKEEKEKKEMKEPTNYRALKTFVTASGNAEFIFQLDELLQGSQAGKDTAILDQIAQLLSGRKNGPVPKINADETTPPPSKRQIKRDLAENGGLVRIKMNLLKGRIAGNKAFLAAQEAAIKELRLSRTKNRYRIVGAMTATTHGGHRSKFLSMIAKAYAGNPDGLDKTLTELAELLTKADKKAVSVAELRREMASQKG